VPSHFLLYQKIHGASRSTKYKQGCFEAETNGHSSPPQTQTLEVRGECGAAGWAPHTETFTGRSGGWIFDVASSRERRPAEILQL
jgi:hypothetical protein